MPPVIQPIRAVVFDAFGTLSDITDKRHPIAKILASYPDRSAGRRLAMATRVDLAAAACATGYAGPLLRLLPFDLDAYGWSFEAGHLKPDPAFYQWVTAALGTAPSETLMVGDTFAADYDGPRLAGMQALHLVRDGAPQLGVASIRCLTEIPPLIEQ